VLAKLQAELEAADPTDLLPRVREVLEAVRQGHALLHALRTALALPAAASMHECAAAATRAHAAAATLSAQAQRLCELLELRGPDALVPAVQRLVDDARHLRPPTSEATA